jgi:hypothetical protein
MNPFLVSATLTQPTATTATATLVLVADQGDSIGPLTLDIIGVSGGIVAMQAVPGTSTYSYTQRDIPAGQAYRVVVYDASPAKLPGFETRIVVDPQPIVTGCTDPSALNYAEGATNENGTCTYSPPAPPAPFFNVPLLQALRFVVRGGDFETMDNVLFCEQARPGQQMRPYFYQLVERGDTAAYEVSTCTRTVSPRSTSW